MAVSSPNWQKTLWEKEKIARYEHFFLFPTVFLIDKYTSEMYKNEGLSGKGLALVKFTYFCNRRSSRTGSPGLFRGSVLEQDTSEFHPCTGKPRRKDINNVSCRRYINEILLKAP